MGDDFPPLPALAVVFGFLRLLSGAGSQENAMAKKLVHCVEGL
jgi:hypothetical protein